jgi:hypothetical protein
VILHDPLDHCGVLIAGDHGFFCFLLVAMAGVLVGIGAAGAEAELEFLLAAGLDDGFLVDAEGQLEAQPRLGGVMVSPEALDHSDAFCWHLINGGEQTEQEDWDERKGTTRPGRKSILGKGGREGGELAAMVEKRWNGLGEGRAGGVAQPLKGSFGPSQCEKYV